jgi:hypothetical protein
VQSTVAADGLAAARAALDEPRPEAWRHPQPDEEIAGTVVRTEEGDLGNGSVPIVVIDTGDGNLRSIWVFHDALRSQLEKLQPQAGDAIAIRYNGKQKSANGRSYHSYTVGSDKPRAQFQWGKQPQRDTAGDPPEGDGDGYRFGDGEPLPPEPDDHPPF